MALEHEHDRGRKPATVAFYRALIKARMLPAFGDMVVQEITAPMVESWLAGLDGTPATRTKAFVAMNGIMRRARKVSGLPFNPVADAERPPAPTPSGDIQVFPTEEIDALVGAAASEQDAAIYLTAAYTGLRRGELIALRWRDVDFAGDTLRVRASYSESGLTTRKSGKVRSVPLSPNVASALAKLRERPRWTGADDVVFPGRSGDFLDGRALRRRYQEALDRAGLRRLRFTPCATPSAPALSASPTSAASRSGWATRTSIPRCATSTTRRARTTRRWWRAPSSRRGGVAADSPGRKLASLPAWTPAPPRGGRLRLRRVRGVSGRARARAWPARRSSRRAHWRCP